MTGAQIYLRRFNIDLEIPQHHNQLPSHSIDSTSRQNGSLCQSYQREDSLKPSHRLCLLNTYVNYISFAHAVIGHPPILPEQKLPELSSTPGDAALVALHSRTVKQLGFCCGHCESFISLDDKLASSALSGFPRNISLKCKKLTNSLRFLGSSIELRYSHRSCHGHAKES